MDPMASAGSSSSGDAEALRSRSSGTESTGADGARPPVQKSHLPILVSLGLLGALVAIYFSSPGFRQEADEAFEILKSGDRGRISEWVRQFGSLGPAVIVIAMTAQMFLLVIPSVVLLVVSVLAYGAVAGALIGFASVLFASAVGYAIGAGVGPYTIERMIGPAAKEKLEDYLDRYGAWTVVVVRLSPVLSNDAVSFVGGLVRMGIFRYLGATAVGIAPLVLLIAYSGESTERLESTLLWVSGASAVALLGYVLFDRKLR